MERWSPPIEAINYHIWRSCNMRCKFCFATYDSILPGSFTGGLPLEEANKLVSALSSAGFRKITFAGGEPTLCPWLIDVVAHAKSVGLKTALVSNGSRLTVSLIDALSANLDWVALSIDSVSEHVNVMHGRAVAGRRTMASGALVSIAERLRGQGVRLKVNTVVTRYNAEEVMLPIIERMRPERWKIMRVLEITGENDRYFPSLSTTSEDLKRFVMRNSPVPLGTLRVVEDNDDMIASYVMVDPYGRFIDNSDTLYKTSSPILSSGVQSALTQISLSREAFENRGGSYDW